MTLLSKWKDEEILERTMKLDKTHNILKSKHEFFKWQESCPALFSHLLYYLLKQEQKRREKKK